MTESADVISILINLFPLVLFPGDGEEQVPREILWALGSTIFLFVLFLIQKVMQAQRLPLMTGYEALTGKHGIAMTNFTDSGIIRLNGELWTARSTKGIITKGDEVIVLGNIAGTLILKVARVSKENSI